MLEAPAAEEDEESFEAPVAEDEEELQEADADLDEAPAGFVEPEEQAELDEHEAESVQEGIGVEDQESASHGARRTQFLAIAAVPAGRAYVRCPFANSKELPRAT